MSGKRNCYDNAVVETFFKSLKAEMLWRQSWPTRRYTNSASLEPTPIFVRTAEIPLWF